MEMSRLLQISPHSCFMPDETMQCTVGDTSSLDFLREAMQLPVGQKLGFPQERDRRQKKEGCGGKFHIFDGPGSTPETLRLAYYFHFCISFGLWQNSGCANRPQSKLNAVAKTKPYSHLCSSSRVLSFPQKNPSIIC